MAFHTENIVEMVVSRASAMHSSCLDDYVMDVLKQKYTMLDCRYREYGVGWVFCHTLSSLRRYDKETNEGGYKQVIISSKESCSLIGNKPHSADER